MLETIQNYFWWLWGYDYPDPYENDPNVVAITKYFDSIEGKKNHKYYFDTAKGHLSH